MRFRSEPSPFLLRMHPLVRRDLLSLGYLIMCTSGAQRTRGFQPPHRRSPRPADDVERQACAGLAAIAFDVGFFLWAFLLCEIQNLLTTIVGKPISERLDVGALVVEDRWSDDDLSSSPPITYRL
jgi:hypothetical protein